MACISVPRIGSDAQLGLQDREQVMGKMRMAAKRVGLGYEVSIAAFLPPSIEVELKDRRVVCRESWGSLA